MSAYYNEHDKNAAAWLRELIKENLIAPGEVDERSIIDIAPSDLAGFTQCHFFTGIGVWSYSLRQAGWPDDRPVWTGSCPCQPFSAAGKGVGVDDERHLWPAWFHLIEQCAPPVVFGEQVAAAVKHGWLDLVSSDLEGIDYAVGAVVMGAHSVGAPHIRQRLWFVAHAEHAKRWPVSLNREDERDRRDAGREEAHRLAGACGEVRQLANTPQRGFGIVGNAAQPGSGGHIDGGIGLEQLGDTSAPGLPLRQRDEVERPGRRQEGRAVEQPSRTFWSDCDWLPCRDGKARPVEPGTFPLADGIADDLGFVRLQSYPDRPHEERIIVSPLIRKGKARVMRLRGYGNAINAEVAKAFIESYLDVEELI